MVKMLQALGMVLLIIGCLAWVETLLENLATFQEQKLREGSTTPIKQVFGLDVAIDMSIDGAIVAVGAIIFVWSTKSSKKL